MYYLAIDQGTTGSTAILFDVENFNPVATANYEFEQHYPRPSWVEHDLNQIWESVENSITKVLKEVNGSAEKIEAIGITNQRETTCAFRKNGNPLAKAIVWQDRRTSELCERLKSEGKEKLFKEKTGLPLDAYFSGTKMNWLLNNNEEVKSAVNDQDLRLGTIDTFLLYKMTNAQSFKTDATNASRTLLMDLKSCQWDSELLDILGIDPNFLPSINSSFGEFGKTAGLSFLPDGIPISGILGDQQSALFGQSCFDSGEMKCTYGTGAFMLLNTGSEIVHSENGLLTTVAYQDQNQCFYALEGSCYIAGAAVQYLRDNLDFFPSSPMIEDLASKATHHTTENVFFFPFFTGIGSPYWKSEAKAAIVGLTRDTGKAEISRACLEGIAFSVDDLLMTMQKDLSKKTTELRVDGGATNNELLLQIQASCSETTVIRPKITETTALGSVFAASIGVGHYTKDTLKSVWKKDFEVSEDTSEKQYLKNKKLFWNKYIEANF